MSDNLKSHIALIKAICDDELVNKEVDSIIVKHMNGANVMGNFKNIFTQVVIDFLSGFQNKRQKIIDNKENQYFGEATYPVVLKSSSQIAILRAQETMKMVYNALKI